MNFNLVSDPWIPVLLGDKQEILSLSETVSHSEEIVSICGDPIVRVSILRLLICITQAALDGPEDEEDWGSSLPRIKSAVKSYLEKWQSHFNLYGDRPFLQVPSLTKIRNRKIYSIDPFAISGSNHSLFDRMSRKPETKVISPDGMAIGLLVKQIFAPCGMDANPIKGAKWGDKALVTTGTSSIAVNILLTVIEGENLLQTIHLNLINKDWLAEAKIDFGKPVWESDILDQCSVDTRKISMTYLYNLVPLSRSILFEDGRVDMSYSAGILACVLPNGGKTKNKSVLPYRDPMGTIVTSKNKDGKLKEDYLKVDPNRALWRDLQSLLQAVQVTEKRKGPWVLRHIANGYNKDVSIISTGFSYNKAKPIISCEWKLFIPVDLLQETSSMLYQELVSNAERVSKNISFAVETYLKLKNLSYEQKKQKKIYQAILSTAQRNYWHALDACAGKLIDGIVNNMSDVQENWKSDVYHSALDAFKQACGKFTLMNIAEYTNAFNFLKRRISNEWNSGASQKVVAGPTEPKE